MARHIVLLRGVNVGGKNRVPMAELREALAEAGFDDVRTLLATGNVVLSSSKGAAAIARVCERAIADRFGLKIAVLTRSHTQLAAVMARDPLGAVAGDPRRYVVTFLAARLSAERAERLASLATKSERLVITAREVYSWHPDGLGRSKLAAALGVPALGVTATARNWATVGKLLALADD